MVQFATRWIPVAIGLAALCCQAAYGSPRISASELVSLLEPLIELPTKHHSKIDERSLKMGRVTIPAPALMVFFDARGCVAAAVGEKQLDAVDRKCITGPDIPERSDFLHKIDQGAVDSSVKSRPDIIMFSPLYDIEVLRSTFEASEAGVTFDEQLDTLDALTKRIRAVRPNAALLEVAVTF